MTSCPSARRAPEKVRTTSVPRWPPRGMMPVTVGDAARAPVVNATSATRAVNNRGISVLRLATLRRSVKRFTSRFSEASLTRQLCEQVLPQFAFVHDDDRPVARGEQFLVRVDAELVVDGVRQVFDRERVVLRLARGRVRRTVNEPALDAAAGQDDAKHL